MSTFPFDVQYNNGYSVKRADNNRRVDPLHGLSFSMPRYSNPTNIVSLSFTFTYTEMETFWDFYDSNIDTPFFITLNISGTNETYTATFIDYPSVSGQSTIYSVSFTISAALAPPLTPAALMAGYDGFFFDFTDESTLWQDTAATSPVITNGQTIARIDDVSGNGYNATQGTAGLRPTFIKSGTYGIGRSDGTDYMTIASSQASLKWAHSGQSAAYFAVYKPNATAQFKSVFGNQDISAANVGINMWYDDTFNTDAFRFAMDTGGGPGNFAYAVLKDSEITTSDYFTHVINIDGVSTVTYYKDRATIKSTSLNTTPSTANATYNMNIFAGGNGNRIINGDIIMCGVRSAKFTQTELLALQTMADTRIAGL